ncbi:MAG: pantoate--beta-alanine ligase [Chitinophagaceae bacterium]|nr:MAG: pantoate--beta-alanine ligase [Chitinophagaceae bacterium]
MILFNRADLLHDHLTKLSAGGARIGFIPTMGALHDGHLELIRQSLTSGNITVCSVFVNPTQFNNATDFNKYPKTLDADIQKLESVGTDVIFVPEVPDIYPGGINNLERFDLGYLETILEGSSRPGHFQGVCQVMKRLLTIVNPHLLFMGQKDYQQCMVITWLLAFMNSHTTLVTVPTIRQADGLAMSSRNVRLSEQGRKQATAIYQALQFVKTNLKPGDLQDLLDQARNKLNQAGFKVDYVEMANATDLKLTRFWDGKTRLVCLVAAFLEEVRLIDNMVVTP